MIELKDFIPLIGKVIERFSKYPPNSEQEDCILAPINEPLMIIAGPGSGKTTVLVLRALRMIFVDGLLPENILITTFTRNAAKEIRSRLVEWGMQIQDFLLEDLDKQSQKEVITKLKRIDINQFITGTLDSICEDSLRMYRNPGEAAPVFVEDFVGKSLLAQKGMFLSGAKDDTGLHVYLSKFARNPRFELRFLEKIDICQTIIDRIIQDNVNIDHFKQHNTNKEGREKLIEIMMRYKNYMIDTNRLDYAGLEELFLNSLSESRLLPFLTNIRALLVDEYQDSNPLQESIYFKIIQNTKASFSVVGDDDQSLYRFRGATVELFCNFSSRLARVIPDLPRTNEKQLINNYRSTPEIVTFLNDYIMNDLPFSQARYQPNKLNIKPIRSTNSIPILGLFRSNASELAQDLAAFLINIFKGDGRIKLANQEYIEIKKNSNDGNFADGVLLAYSVRELGTSFNGSIPRERLPLLLRRELKAKGIKTFNPKGQDLRDFIWIQRLLGLLLSCIEKDQSLVDRLSITTDARNYINKWKIAASEYIESNPLPNLPHTLRDFVNAWQWRKSQNPDMKSWPTEWPILGVCYKLITWMPYFLDDPEGQVYLEAIARCAAQAASFSPFNSNIIFGDLEERSIRSIIMDMLVQIAYRSIEVDEELISYVPRNSFPIMTIHQAKGLEFPLVIVDVASDFSRDSDQQRIFRFPEEGGITHKYEDDLAPFCEIGGYRTSRAALDRAFDDLKRLYYVAYSRSQSVLVLAGLSNCLSYNTKIRHVATGWSSDNRWSWRIPVPKPNPTLANNLPLELI